MIKLVTRCHRCGTSKGAEDIGIFVPLRTIDGKAEYVVWFHSEECKMIWISDYADQVTITG